MVSYHEGFDVDACKARRRDLVGVFDELIDSTAELLLVGEIS